MGRSGGSGDYSNEKDEFNAEEVIAFSKSKMAKFEVPKALVLIDDLPKGLTGKVLKKRFKRCLKTVD